MEKNPAAEARKAFDALLRALVQLKTSKPGDRKEEDRYYQIVITDMEKVIGTFKTYVLTPLEGREHGTQ